MLNVDPISPDSAIVRLPDVLLLEVFEQLPRHGRLSVMRCCRALHFLVAKTIYTDVRVLGTAVRDFFTTILESTKNPTIYATFVLRLQFTAQGLSNQTMMLFCRSILRLENLHRLALVVPTWRSATLAKAMQNDNILQGVQIWANRQQESNRPISALGPGRRVHLRADVHEFDHSRALSRLRHLSIEGDPLFAVICVDRVIESVRIVEPMKFYEFGDFCHILQGSNYRHRLTHLEIYLAARMMDACECIDKLVSVILGLTNLSIGQTTETSRYIFHRLIDRPNHFPALQVFQINSQINIRINDLEAEAAHVRRVITRRLGCSVLRTRLRRINVYEYTWELDNWTDVWRQAE